MIHSSYTKTIFVTLFSLSSSGFLLYNYREEISKYIDSQMHREKDVIILRRQMLQEDIKRSNER
jgi:hypothetical protein